jgi:arsenate reductase
MQDRPFNVLFLCTGNSARSIMAEAILNKLGAGKFRAYSAGSQPKGRVNPHTIQLLQSLGYDTSGFRSKSWNEFAKPCAPPLDFAFTVCDNAAGEICPVWPGQPMTARWGVPDPAEANGSAAEIALRSRIPTGCCISASACSLRCLSEASISSACNSGSMRSVAWMAQRRRRKSRADARAAAARILRMVGDSISARGRRGLRHHGAKARQR